LKLRVGAQGSVPELRVGGVTYAVDVTGRHA
jgi:hypothetical protein